MMAVLCALYECVYLFKCFRPFSWIDVQGYIYISVVLRSNDTNACFVHLYLRLFSVSEHVLHRKAPYEINHHLFYCKEQHLKQEQ